MRWCAIASFPLEGSLRIIPSRIESCEPMALWPVTFDEYKCRLEWDETSLAMASERSTSFRRLGEDSDIQGETGRSAKSKMLQTLYHP